MDLLTFYIGFELALLLLLALIGGWGEKHSPAARPERFILYPGGKYPDGRCSGCNCGQVHTHGNGTFGPSLSPFRKGHCSVTNRNCFGSVLDLWVIGPWTRHQDGSFTGSHLATDHLQREPSNHGRIVGCCCLEAWALWFQSDLPCHLYRPHAMNMEPSVLGTLGAIAVVYGALAALAQTDLKLLLPTAV